MLRNMLRRDKCGECMLSNDKRVYMMGGDGMVHMYFLADLRGRRGLGLFPVYPGLHTCHVAELHRPCSCNELCPA